MSCFLINIHRQGTNQIWHVSMSYTKVYPWRWPTLVLKSINYKFYRHSAGLAKFSWRNHGWSDGQILTAVLYISMVDPDLQIRGGGGAGGGEGDDLKKKFFRPFGPHFRLKIRGEGRPPGPLPWIRHCIYVFTWRVRDFCTIWVFHS